MDDQEWFDDVLKKAKSLNETQQCDHIIYTRYIYNVYIYIICIIIKIGRSTVCCKNQKQKYNC